MPINCNSLWVYVFVCLLNHCQRTCAVYLFSYEVESSLVGDTIDWKNINITHVFVLSHVCVCVCVLVYT